MKLAFSTTPRCINGSAAMPEADEAEEESEEPRREERREW